MVPRVLSEHIHMCVVYGLLAHTETFVCVCSTKRAKSNLISFLRGQNVFFKHQKITNMNIELLSFFNVYIDKLYRTLRAKMYKITQYVCGLMLAHSHIDAFSMTAYVM